MPSPAYRVSNINKVIRSFDRAVQELDRRQKQINKAGIDAIERSAKKRTFPRRFRNVQDNNLPANPPRRRRVRATNPFRKRSSANSAILVMKAYETTVRLAGSHALDPVILKAFQGIGRSKDLERETIRLRKRGKGDKIVNGKIKYAEREGSLRRRRKISSIPGLPAWVNRTDRGLQKYRHVVRMPAALRVELTLDPAQLENQDFIEKLSIAAARKAFSI